MKRIEVTAPAPKNPAAGSPPVSHRAARASVPGGPAAPGSPPLAAGGKTSPQQRHGRVAAAEMPSPGTREADPAAGNRLPASPGRGRPETPAGASGHDSPPAGSRGLSGAEWRAAAKRAQSGRQPSRGAPRAAAKVTIPPPVTGGTVLTATATCLVRCGWTAGPGDPAEVDKSAERHTTRPPKHPTSVASKVAGATERPGAA